MDTASQSSEREDAPGLGTNRARLPDYGDRLSRRDAARYQTAPRFLFYFLRALDLHVSKADVVVAVVAHFIHPSDRL